MTDEPNDLQLPDPDDIDWDDIDWDVELEGLPREQILIEYAARRVMRLVDQWYGLRAGDAIGFEDMPDELNLDPDQKIGLIVVDQFAEAICEVFELEYTGIGADRGQKLIGAILGCISQGVAIGLGAIPDNDDDSSSSNEDEIEESR
jgi:hypothetical protein